MANLPPDVLAGLAAKRLGLAQQRDVGLANLKNQYSENISNLDKFAGEGTTRINDQMASQGLFNSGIRVDQQGKLQQNVAQRRGFLEQGYGTGQYGLHNQYQQGMAGLQGEESNLMNQYQQQELGKQQQDAQMAFQQQQAEQQRQQLAQQQWYAAAAANQANQAPAPVAGPNQADLDNWYNAAAARDLWNATLWWNAVAAQNQPLKEYQGGVGRVM